VQEMPGLPFSILNFVQPTVLYIVDKSPYGNGLGNPWVRLHFLNLSPHVLLDINECVEMVRRKGGGSGLILESREQIVILESQHPAVGVVDDHELSCAQQIVGDDQRPQRVFYRDTTGVSNHMNVPHHRGTPLLTWQYPETREGGGVTDIQPVLPSGLDRAAEF